MINEGTTPTCVRPQGISIVNLTWATPKIGSKIKNWKVEEANLSLSDHNYITFNIEISRTNKARMKKGRNTNESPRWKMDTLDQEMYDEVLEWKCSMLDRSERREDENEDKDVDWIRQTMTEAADTSMQMVRKRSTNYKRQVFWWNEEIAELREKCIRDRRRWTRVKTRKKKKESRQRGSEVDVGNLRNLEGKYRESRKKVVKAIYCAKEEAWKDLIKQIDRDQWRTPYRVVMNRLRAADPGNGTLEKDKLDRLIFKLLFPRETEEVEDEVTNVGIWKQEWNISSEELCKAIRREKNKNIAPGLDGISLKMWRKVPSKMIEKVVEILNKFMREGKFPRKWKYAKLVLIPKGKNDKLDIPKARSICLIDDIAKCLGKIIVERIEGWMEYMVRRRLAFAAIGKNQYAFTKNKSTIDALSRVKEIVEEARKRGDTTVLISLDIKNAFNNIP